MKISLFCPYSEALVVAYKLRQIMLPREGVCAAPKSMGFAPFWSENGYKLLPYLVWIRVWFSRELRKYMNVSKFKMGFEKPFQGQSSNSYGDIIFYRPGFEKVWKVTFFGLRQGQDLENRAAHPTTTKNSMSTPPGCHQS